MHPDADLLLVNANVITMDQARPRAAAVTVAGGRITGVYDDNPDATAREVIDLKGATLIPGFQGSDAYPRVSRRAQSHGRVRPGAHRGRPPGDEP
jgi:predicted amidohydrolase YtcJ